MHVSCGFRGGKRGILLLVCVKLRKGSCLQRNAITPSTPSSPIWCETVSPQLRCCPKRRPRYHFASLLRSALLSPHSVAKSTKILGVLRSVGGLSILFKDAMIHLPHSAALRCVSFVSFCVRQFIHPTVMVFPSPRWRKCSYAWSETKRRTMPHAKQKWMLFGVCEAHTP